MSPAQPTGDPAPSDGLLPASVLDGAERRSLSLYATSALADGIADPIIASRAKLQICRSARLIGQEAIQMHGGIGMTAEYPIAHYVSRLTAISHTLGDASDHVTRLAENIDTYDMLSVG